MLTLLHLVDGFLVKQASGLLVEGAVDGDDVTLGEELIKVLDSSAANLLFNLGLKRLVIKVEELLAVEGLETSENTLSNTADGNSADHLVF